MVTCTKLVVYCSSYKATQIALSDASKCDCMHPCAQIWQSDGASGKKVSFFSMETNTSISMSRQLILKWADFGSLTPAKASKDKNSAIGSLFCTIRLMCQKLPVFKLILNVTLPYFFREWSINALSIEVIAWICTIWQCEDDAVSTQSR